MSRTRFAAFSTLTFDVVGTLIDFETGILDWFRPLLAGHGAARADEEILCQFALYEDRYQQRAPDKPFTQMLPLICRDMAENWGLALTSDQAEAFRRSIRSWPAFADAVSSLQQLHKRYRLVAVTNADAWALQYMSATLGNPFDEQITCDEVGVNKPSPRVFDHVLAKLAPSGIAKADVLHVAQSQYHDIVPATAHGFATMWIERRHGRPGFGATPEPVQTAVPTFHAVSMADFVNQVFDCRVIRRKTETR